MKGMKLYKKAAGGYLSALEESKPELFKTIKNYRDRLSGGEQETFDKRANIQYAATMNMPKSQRDAYISSIEKEYSKPTDTQFKQVKSSLGQKFKPTYTYIAKDSDKPAATTGYYRDLSSEIAEADKKLKALTLTESKTRQVPAYTYYEGASGPPGLAGSRPGVARTTTQIPKGSTYSPGGQQGFQSIPAGYTSPSGQRYARTGSKNVTETFTRPQRAGDPEYDKQAALLQRLRTRDSFKNMPQFTGQGNLTSQNVYQQLGMAKSGGLKEDIQKIKKKEQKFSLGGRASVRGTKFKGVF